MLVVWFFYYLVCENINILKYRKKNDYKVRSIMLHLLLNICFHLIQTRK